MKKIRYLIILVLTLLCFSQLSAQTLKFGDAKGLFLSIGTGPKVPLGDFADTHNIGIGFDVNFSYTDNFVLPVFFTAKIGYQNFPGLASYYRKSNHSSISSEIINLSGGIRFYLPPLLENIVILMPIVEAGIDYSFITTSNQYKIDSGISNFTEDLSKFGFHFGGGVSMFMLDVVGYYTYLHNAQYLSMDLRLRIPIYIKM